MRRRRSKAFRNASEKIVKEKIYSLSEGIRLVKETAFAKFDESIDIAFRLGVDPRHADQMIRGALSLPSGTGKKTRLCVITQGENLEKAEKAGADHVGSDDMIAKISNGWLEFDRVIASPDMMGKLGRIGRVLGPRGLMPNPKLGTVAVDITKAVSEQKAGKVEYRTEKTGIVQVLVGKKSFSDEELEKNIKTVITTIVKARPASAKGTYLKSLTLSSTMGPGVKLNTQEALNFSGQ